MAMLSEEDKLLVDGYIRELYSSKAVPAEINDLIFLFYYLIIGSEMLTKEEEEQLMEWIDDSNKCDFKLLYKATRDGFGTINFHEKCDGKGANISIIKSEQQCIFGGYSSVSWHNKNKCISDNFAWLYSLRNKKGIQKKFQILKDEEEDAMQGYNYFGPAYGEGDLYIYNNCNENEYSNTDLGGSYEWEPDHQLNDGTKYFKVLDYEIWQIVKKGL